MRTARGTGSNVDVLHVDAPGTQADFDLAGCGAAGPVPDSIASPDGQFGDDEELRTRHVGFCDVNALNFLIDDVSIRLHIEDMEYEQTTVSTGRITKQGVRDLNHYGARRAKEVAAEAPPVADAPT